MVSCAVCVQTLIISWKAQRRRRRRKDGTNEKEDEKKSKNQRSLKIVEGSKNSPVVEWEVVNRRRCATGSGSDWFRLCARSRCTFSGSSNFLFIALENNSAPPSQAFLSLEHRKAIVIRTTPRSNFSASFKIIYAAIVSLMHPSHAIEGWRDSQKVSNLVNDRHTETRLKYKMSWRWRGSGCLVTSFTH